MQTLGLIGGISWISTVDYYKLIFGLRWSSHHCADRCYDKTIDLIVRRSEQPKQGEGKR